MGKKLSCNGFISNNSLNFKGDHTDNIYNLLIERNDNPHQIIITGTINRL